MSNERYDLSTGDVAQRLAVSVQTVSRWADSGDIACILTPGNQRRFRQADVDGFVETMKERQASAVGQYNAPSKRGVA